MTADEVRQLRKHRAEERAQFGPLFSEVAGILFRLDPIRINYEVNADEYEPEAGTILPRLHHVNSEAAAREVIHQEFVRWFGVRIAGPPERYTQVAAEIWAAWREWTAGHAGRIAPLSAD